MSIAALLQSSSVLRNFRIQSGERSAIQDSTIRLRRSLGSLRAPCSFWKSAFHPILRSSEKVLSSLRSGKGDAQPLLASGSVRSAVRAVQMDSEAPKDVTATRLGFIGAGQMAESLARGWQTSGVLQASNMVATDVNTSRLDVFKSFGVAAAKDAQEVAANSDIIFIAVKPYTVQKVLTELRKNDGLKDRHLIVSIAAGVTLGSMQTWAGPGVRVIRVMPNTPCLVGEAAAAMSVGTHATTPDAQTVLRLFRAVGKIHSVEEKLLDAVTGLSGSGPAYVFIAIEALADGGVQAGLPRDVALSLAAQTVYGSAKMVLETGKHPGQLKDSVASPGGTTIAGIHELEKGGFRNLLMNAVTAAARRGKEMANE